MRKSVGISPGNTGQVRI